MIDPGRIRAVDGFGQTITSEGYVFTPHSVDELQDLIGLAHSQGRPVVARGMGRSYGDAALLAEAIVLDMRRLNSVAEWDPDTGRLRGGAGLTIADLWRQGIGHGFWPAVVPGTMRVSIGGALGTNIHGKNHRRMGSFAEHVEASELLDGTGQVHRIQAGTELFKTVVGSAGQLGVITEAELHLKRVPSGMVSVLERKARSWEEMLDCFDGSDEYEVGWVDHFSGDGRGLFHGASTLADGRALSVEEQTLPEKSPHLWRVMKWLNRPGAMRLVNGVKYGLAGSTKRYEESLVAFNFLLDYVPDWREAYLPEGLVQIQFFVPEAQAARVFREIHRVQRAMGQIPFLSVLKRHRQDPFLLTWALDGYSLAMDFKNHPSLPALHAAMAEIVLSSGGRFHLAKDSLMTPEDARRCYGDAALEQLRRWKAELDPQGVFSSSLARRLNLFEPKTGLKVDS